MVHVLHPELLTTVAGHFAPGHAALGGLLLGVATVAQLLLNGRVLGMSGVLKGLFVQKDPGSGRLALVAGLTAAAIPLSMLMPSAFTPLPDSTFSLTRAAVGGLLVGFGAALGNGCTSGHGICGLSRFSPRSAAYTLLFMASGALFSTLSGAASATGVAVDLAPTLLLPSEEVVSFALRTASAAAITFAVIGVSASITRSKTGSSTSLAATLAGPVSSFLIGATFAAGLALSGMTMPSKVASFLSPLSAAWDPSLAFVMGSALAVSSVAYQAVLGRLPVLPKELKAPLSSGGTGTGSPLITTSYALPTFSKVDWKLASGAVLFGAGWGVSGICPGPAVVGLAGALANAWSTGTGGLSAVLAVYVGSMLTGFFIEQEVSITMK
ncbi:hypothetical protein CEUSTIGMA_g8173.t1 [Chlamydomonas eustigma]|uniref:Uncharacterized protein n=1 Tax=Chlamydomonas eustigma TaxID=1157962 RepID=A0A250XCC9_9CHLO|nr:hypothetical protein CEUSTIGMA_g8173.t1 [Chlamydomonas eustigma]|eukprot:GAX80738.1 hypothetical protein CEUSTIGMA_g8173.t1 [Chlamydomonas eustigma]